MSNAKPKMTICLLSGKSVRLRFDRANARHRRKREAYRKAKLWILAVYTGALL